MSLSRDNSCEININTMKLGKLFLNLFNSFRLKTQTQQLFLFVSHISIRCNGLYSD